MVAEAARAAAECQSAEAPETQLVEAAAVVPTVVGSPWAAVAESLHTAVVAGHIEVAAGTGSAAGEDIQSPEAAARQQDTQYTAAVAVAVVAGRSP